MDVDGAQAQRVESRQILIVDDDPQVLGLFTNILSDGGYDVRAVESGKAAMQAVLHDPIDLLVLDLSMPEPDGFEMLKVLRSTRPDLKILVISGFIQGVLLRAAQLVGATATLHKTEAPELLLQTVRDLLR
jgi:CheY-like chemotaxis protein